MFDLAAVVVAGKQRRRRRRTTHGFDHDRRGTTISGFVALRLESSDGGNDHIDQGVELSIVDIAVVDDPFGNERTLNDV